MKTTRILSVLVLLAAGGPLFAQDSPAPPGFFLMSEVTVEQADSADWAEAATMTAKAHAKHPKGNFFATYSKLTGGPHQTVRVFFPINRMGDLDDWVSNHQILAEVLGRNRARIVESDLDLASEVDERILAFSEKLSRPWPNFQAPRFAWVEEVTVAEDKMVEYAALIGRVIRAFEQHGAEGYWVVYGNAIGGDNSTLIWMYGFDQFAEIDAWDSRLETLAKALPEGEGARLMAALEAITQTEVSIWQMEPAMSQFEGEQR